MITKYYDLIKEYIDKKDYDNAKKFYDKLEILQKEYVIAYLLTNDILPAFITHCIKTQQEKISVYSVIEKKFQSTYQTAITTRQQNKSNKRIPKLHEYSELRELFSKIMVYTDIEFAKRLFDSMASKHRPHLFSINNLLNVEKIAVYKDLIAAELILIGLDYQNLKYLVKKCKLNFDNLGKLYDLLNTYVEKESQNKLTDQAQVKKSPITKNLLNLIPLFTELKQDKAALDLIENIWKKLIAQNSNQEILADAIYLFSIVNRKTQEILFKTSLRDQYYFFFNDLSEEKPLLFKELFFSLLEEDTQLAIELYENLNIENSKELFSETATSNTEQSLHLKTCQLILASNLTIEQLASVMKDCSKLKFFNRLGSIFVELSKNQNSKLIFFKEDTLIKLLNLIPELCKRGYEFAYNDLMKQLWSNLLSADNGENNIIDAIAIFKKTTKDTQTTLLFLSLANPCHIKFIFTLLKNIELFPEIVKKIFPEINISDNNEVTIIAERLFEFYQNINSTAEDLSKKIIEHFLSYPKNQITAMINSLYNSSHTEKMAAARWVFEKILLCQENDNAAINIFLELDSKLASFFITENLINAEENNNNQLKNYFFIQLFGSTNNSLLLKFIEKISSLDNHIEFEAFILQQSYNTSWSDSAFLKIWSELFKFDTLDDLQYLNLKNVVLHLYLFDSNKSKKLALLLTKKIIKAENYLTEKLKIEGKLTAEEDLLFFIPDAYPDDLNLEKNALAVTLANSPLYLGILLPMLFESRTSVEFVDFFNLNYRARGFQAKLLLKIVCDIDSREEKIYGYPRRTIERLFNNAIETIFSTDHDSDKFLDKIFANIIQLSSESDEILPTIDLLVKKLWNFLNTESGNKLITDFFKQSSSARLLAFIKKIKKFPAIEADLLLKISIVKEKLFQDCLKGILFPLTNTLEPASLDIEHAITIITQLKAINHETSVELIATILAIIAKNSNYQSLSKFIEKIDPLPDLQAKLLLAIFANSNLDPDNESYFQTFLEELFYTSIQDKTLKQTKLFRADNILKELKFNNFSLKDSKLLHDQILVWRNKNTQCYSPELIDHEPRTSINNVEEILQFIDREEIDSLKTHIENWNGTDNFEAKLDLLQKIILIDELAAFKLAANMDIDSQKLILLCYCKIFVDRDFNDQEKLDYLKTLITSYLALIPNDDDIITIILNLAEINFFEDCNIIKTILFNLLYDRLILHNSIEQNIYNLMKFYSVAKTNDCYTDPFCQFIEQFFKLNLPETCFVIKNLINQKNEKDNYLELAYLLAEDLVKKTSSRSKNMSQQEHLDYLQTLFGFFKKNTNISNNIKIYELLMQQLQRGDVSQIVNIFYVFNLIDNPKLDSIEFANSILKKLTTESVVNSINTMSLEIKIRTIYILLRFLEKNKDNTLKNNHIKKFFTIFSVENLTNIIKQSKPQNQKNILFILHDIVNQDLFSKILTKFDNEFINEIIRLNKADIKRIENPENIKIVELDNDNVIQDTTNSKLIILKNKFDLVLNATLQPSLINQAVLPTPTSQNHYSFLNGRQPRQQTNNDLDSGNETLGLIM